MTTKKRFITRVCETEGRKKLKLRNRLSLENKGVAGVSRSFCAHNNELISNYLVIVFEKNMIIVLLLAGMDKRLDSALKRPLISEFFRRSKAC